MIELVNTKCCGVGEINNLAHAQKSLDVFISLEARLHQGYIHYGSFKKYGAITITSVTARVTGDHASSRIDDYGQAFADYVSEHKLGVIGESARFTNWTGNEVVLWVWVPDYTSIFAHIESLKPPSADLTSLP